MFYSHNRDHKVPNNYCCQHHYNKPAYKDNYRKNKDTQRFDEAYVFYLFNNSRGYCDVEDPNTKQDKKDNGDNQQQ